MEPLFFVTRNSDRFEVAPSVSEGKLLLEEAYGLPAGKVPLVRSRSAHTLLRSRFLLILATGLAFIGLVGVCLPSSARCWLPTEWRSPFHYRPPCRGRW